MGRDRICGSMIRKFLCASQSGPPLMLRWLGFVPALASTWLMLSVQPAAAQLLGRYIPDYAPGLTGTPEDVEARTQPDYESAGVRAGSFIVRPRLLESLGYDSNVDGVPGGRGSATVSTQALLGVASDWSRNSVAAQLGVDDQRYPERAQQSFTSWNASLGGTYDIGYDRFAGSYNHVSAVQTPRDLGVSSAVPVPFQVDTVDLAYTVATHGRLSFVPDVDLASYRFDNVVLAGIGEAPGTAFSQNWQSRVVVQGELATRYELSPQRYALVVLRGTQVSYTSMPASLGSRNSAGGAVLVGVDYGGIDLLRFRGLVGYQQRSFVNSQYSTIRSPIIEASATWTPQRLTTLSAIVRREIDDSAVVSSAAITATSVQVRVAHELQRNVVLTGFGQYERGDFSSAVRPSAAALFPQSSVTQNIFSAGLGATWLLSREVRLGASYQFSDRQAGPQLGYTEHVALLTLGFGL